ncbi:AAA family ATPase [Candidatus Poribacteria bacterium]|nr:AAA family ATPase [Candidatus Poribacteria bacterium]
MQCPKCHHQNPPQAKFCMECGAKLEQICSKCGAELPPEAKFCTACGTQVADGVSVSDAPAIIPKLEDLHGQLQSLIPEALAQKYLTAEQSAIGENRLITALFVDISGFTSLSATRSSETMFQLMQVFFKQLVNVVTRYEGRISGFRGDGLLALFGAPILHENDPERAILAAIDMRNTIQSQGLEVTIGINTAWMTVGEIQTELHKEYTAYGPDIILAKRLQETAKPGQILVGEDTYRPTRRAFAFQPLPPLTLKGIAEPVSAYQVLEPLPRPEKVRGIEGLRAEMIGREKEFAELKACVDNLLAGKGQIVSIVGEAGVGKSRLVSELKIYLNEAANHPPQSPRGQGEGIIESPPHASRNLALERSEGTQYAIRNTQVGQSAVLWLEGRCISIGESIGYWVFIDILRSYLEFSESDTPKVLGEKIVDQMKLLFPQRWEAIVPYIGNLLSVKFGNRWDEKVKHAPAEQVKHQTFLALREVFLTLASQKPTLLTLEDLHWADNLSLELLSLLMADLTRAPLMLLCVYRPEKDHKSWHIITQASEKCLERYKEITLRALNLLESQRLVESLLCVENLPETVKASILQKAEGNPFFVEEVLRSLIASGVIYRDGERWIAKADVESIEVPDTIQSVIMARIDRLEAEARYILQNAAVIGKLFRRQLLEDTMQQAPNLDEYLSQLEEKELIYEERTVPEPEYSFKHALIQETLYRKLTSYHRQALHQKVAEGIERLYQERIEEFYEELAMHYSRSGCLPKAIDYLLQAGNKAKRMYANPEAIRYFESALRCIQAQPADRGRISQETIAREALGDVLFTTGAHHEAEVQLNHALDLASRQQNVPHRAALTYKLADMIHWQGEFDRAIEIAESGLAALGEGSHSPEAANLLEVLSRSYHAKGDLEAARRYANRNAHIIRQIPYVDSIYKSYYWLAWVEMGEGNFQAARDWLEELEQLCLAHNNEVGLARCYHGLGDLWRSQNDFRQASQWFEKSLVYCERTGETHFLLEGHLELAHLLILLDADESQIEANIQRGLDIAIQMANTPYVASAPLLCKRIGDAYLQKGDNEQAMFYFRCAMGFGPSTAVLSSVLCDLERLYVHQGQHEAFFDFCQQQMTFQSQTSLRYWHLQPGAPCADYAQLVWWDAFDGTPLREGWHWMDPQGKSHYHCIPQGGILELRTSVGQHDLASTNPSVPRLIRQISGNFAVETRLVGITEGECQIAGLLLWESEKSYLSFAKRSTLINNVRLEACQKGYPEIIGRGWLPPRPRAGPEGMSLAPPAGGGGGSELYLRLERRGESMSALCSDDGKQWQSCGKISFPVADPVWIGLYAACPAGLSDSVARFKEFKLFRGSGE